MCDLRSELIVIVIVIVAVIVIVSLAPSRILLLMPMADMTEYVEVAVVALCLFAWALRTPSAMPLAALHLLGLTLFQSLCWRPYFIGLLVWLKFFGAPQVYGFKVIVSRVGVATR